MRKKTAARQFKDARRVFREIVQTPIMYTVYAGSKEAPLFARDPESNPAVPRLGRPVFVKDRGAASYSITERIHIFHVGVYEPEDIDNLLMDLFDKYIGYGLGDL